MRYPERGACALLPSRPHFLTGAAESTVCKVNQRRALCKHLVANTAAECVSCLPAMAWLLYERDECIVACSAANGRGVRVTGRADATFALLSTFPLRLRFTS